VSLTAAWTYGAVGVCVLAALLVGAWLFLGRDTGASAPQRTLPGAPAIGGPFQLVDQTGRPTDQSVLTGRWSAVFFGYTFCPDTCPTTLTALGQAQRRLGASGSRFQTIFISVDPARDTPAQLKAYLDNPAFPTGTLGLTGSTAAVAAAARAYKVYFARVGSGADYTVDHSAAIYLMGPDGRFRRPLSHAMAPDLIASQIRAAMSEPG
jgi:protein SCO1/2